MKRICVYCGARGGVRDDYLTAADELGALFAAQGIGLIYGGASIGMMGRIADSVVAHGGEAIGVIPQALTQREIVHDKLSELIVVKDMHERKALMEARADGFIAMPGGLGTLEELLEMLTWAKLEFHNKPCAALNVGGFYDPLAAVLAHVAAEGFADEEDCELMITESSPARLLERMREFILARDGG